MRTIDRVGLAAALFARDSGALPRRRKRRRSARSSGSIRGSIRSSRASARVERIAEGFDWSEGPVWDRRGGFLLFSDVPLNTVFKWQEGKGVSVFLKPSGYTGTDPARR